jgi:hypothetical protein
VEEDLTRSGTIPSSVFWQAADVDANLVYRDWPSISSSGLWPRFRAPKPVAISLAFLGDLLRYCATNDAA